MEEGWGRGGEDAGWGGAQDQAHIWHSGQLTIKMLYCQETGSIGAGGGRQGGRGGLSAETSGRASAATRARAALPPAPPSLPPALSLSCSHRLVLIIFFLIYFFPQLLLLLLFFFSFNFLKNSLHSQRRRPGGGRVEASTEAGPQPIGRPELPAPGLSPALLPHTHPPPPSNQAPPRIRVPIFPCPSS